MAALIVLALLIYRDFGVAWDERYTHEYGKLLLDFLGSGDRAWEGFTNLRFYGPVVAVLQALVDRAASSLVRGYQLGHLLTFSIFVTAVMAFYGLCKRQFGSWTWGVLGAAFLVLSPRPFSHAFVNSKDGPLMALAVVAFYLLVRYLESHRVRWIVATALASALAIDVRINALFIVGVIGVTLLVDGIGSQDPHATRRLLIHGALYVSLIIIVGITLWPFMWSHPVAHFTSVLRTMSRFGEGPRFVMYMGRYLPVHALPWHYIPWWIMITTPIPYLVLAAVGLIGLPIRKAAAMIQQRSVDRLLLIYAFWLLGPIVAVVIARVALYDEWRQLLFVYPPLIVFAVAGAHRVWGWLGRTARGLKVQKLWAVALVGILAFVGVRMSDLHPYEGLYFNELVGGPRGAQSRYDRDYWGLSYREGLSHLLDTTSGTIKLTVCTYPGTYARLLFPRAEANRFHYVALRDADYYMCAERRSQASDFPQFPTVFTVGRDGASFLYIKRLPRG